MIKFKEHITEAKKEKYQVYHHTFTSAVAEVGRYIASHGYDFDEDDYWSSVATGNKKPSSGKTNRYKVKLTKDGKETKKFIAFQVYGMGKNTKHSASDKFELNMYIT